MNINMHIKMLCLSFLLAPAIVNSSPSQAALSSLMYGILTSNSRMVERALKKHPDTTVRLSPYGDTPLMVAMRMYGRTLQIAVSGNGEKISNEIKKAFFASIVTAFVPSNTGTDGWLKTFIIRSAVFTGSYLLLSLPSWVHSSSPARIVELLIEHEQHIETRNKEGLTASDILKAYYPYAYQLQDPRWFKLLNLLLRKEGKKTITHSYS